MREFYIPALVDLPFFFLIGIIIVIIMAIFDELSFQKVSFKDALPLVGFLIVLGFLWFCKLFFIH
jgi:hypothetical protein